MAAIRCLGRSMSWVRRVNLRLISTSADDEYVVRRYIYEDLFLRCARPFDDKGLMDELAKRMREQRWPEAKHLFELWLFYKNKPTVDAYNHYLRAKLMTGASTTHLIYHIEAMLHYDIAPNSDSFNILLNSIHSSSTTPQISHKVV